ncbi:MAG: hypothetical protein QG642_126 [Patescibacteria group bacterium]|nr:hypothetical protein [Patescibacteria group bacterium]
MSNLFKKIFVSFSVLSVVVWSSGASALTDQAMANEDELTNKMVTVCHTDVDDVRTEIEVAMKDLDAHLEAGDVKGRCPHVELIVPPVVVHGEWCSALLGIFQSPMDNNQVINLLGDSDLSDVPVMAEWYEDGNNTACHARFDATFDQSNYLNIDWCAGLLQGVKDGYGSHVGDAKYSEMFNLVDNEAGGDIGAINLSDHSKAVGLAAAGDQAACYAYYNFPAWPTPICGNGQIEEGEQCDDANTVSGDACSATCQIEVPQPTATRSQWCSALYGIMQSPMDNNLVIDIDGNGTVDLSDNLSPWYTANNDAACYGRFDLGDGEFNFNQENYTNIDWCAGLAKGVSDFYGTSTTTAEFSTIFDLNDDGSINLIDVGVLAGLVTAGDQAACYAHYVPPMPQWSVDPQNCESVEHATSYNAYPDCGVTACESGYVLTGGACVAENRSSGGGGGGGGGSYSAFNIFNVQNSSIGTSANITWQTNRQSLTWMLYGTSTSYGSEYQGANYHTAHTLELTNLLPGTLYHYQVRAKDASNNTVYDIDRTFTTPGFVPQVLGVKEEACIPDVDGDIKDVMNFINGSLIRACGPGVYHVLGNKMYHVPNWQYLHDNYFAQRIYNVAPEVLDQYTQTMTDDKSVRGNGVQKVSGTKLYADGTLLKAKDGKIYVIMNGHKVHIVSLEDLKKYAGNKMYSVTDQVLNQY